LGENQRQSRGQTKDNLRGNQGNIRGNIRAISECNLGHFRGAGGHIRRMIWGKILGENLSLFLINMGILDDLSNMGLTT